MQSTSLGREHGLKTFLIARPLVRARRFILSVGTWSVLSGLSSACVTPVPGSSATAVEPQASSDKTEHGDDVTAQSIEPNESVELQRARALAQRVIILDGHVDLPYRLAHIPAGETVDLTRHLELGDFDWPRAREGGLDAPFMSIYTAADLEAQGKSKQTAEALIDLVESIERRFPNHFEIARSPADVRRIAEEKKIALPMGMENGSPIEGKIENVRYFYERGIRYITLAHAKDNHISDSSYDTQHTHGGLSAFGKDVVREMNRVGIMIDVAHISDQAFWQVMELSEVPVIASHSSCRHFTPGFERNMSDDMIRALAAKGGVIQINFGSSFLDQNIRADWERRDLAIEELLARHGISNDMDPRAAPLIRQYNVENPGAYSTVEKVADHIDHVVKLVGAKHVGFGSDFDGVGDSLPVGLKDVSDYPNLIRVLLERGYSEAEIRQIAGENVLRVWSAVERYAANTNKH